MSTLPQFTPNPTHQPIHFARLRARSNLALVLALVTVTPLLGGAVAQDPNTCDPAAPCPPEAASPVGAAECPTTECADSMATAASPQTARYAVVAPVGRQTVPMITQGPRLDTLEGKTIALVGGSFMAQVTHGEIKRLILANYPRARVLMFDDVGAAGAFPGPGVIRQSNEEFQRNLIAMGVHAVVSGNGGCGLCTPKEAGSSISAETLGIPAVTVAAPSFVAQVYSTGVNNGVPAPRVAVYPGAFATHTREELIRNTREVVWPQVVAALTQPITPEEIADRRKAIVGETREIVITGTVEEIHAHFTKNRWSDGLPIIPPTVDKVEAFLRFTDRAWDETVAVLPIAHRDTQVWHVAVNGVMAGCPPEFMPLLLALTEALADPSQRRVLASTHGWTPYTWINGPVARQLGIDFRQGQISEPRNAVIGRFLNLAMLNLSGYYIKQDRMGTFGYPMSWCMTEDEAACLRVGWTPYHVQKGYSLNDSTVTLGSALLWGNNLTPATPDPEKIMQVMAWDIVEKSQFATGSGRPFTFRTILITEYIASQLATAYSSKDRLEGALIATARRPAYERAFASYWASPGRSYDPNRYSLDQHVNRVIREENAELTDPPPWFPKQSGVRKIHTVSVMRQGMTPILITGDRDRNKVQTIPGGGYATVRIHLPANWDALMEELGYRPLGEFFL